MCKNENGQTAIMSRRVMESLDKDGTSIEEIGTEFVCPAITLVTVYRAVKEIAEIIIICYEIHEIMEKYGILDAIGTHEPGEPYAPYWPYPHFEIVDGQINYN